MLRGWIPLTGESIRNHGLKEDDSMKKFLTMLLTMNLVLAVVCYVTTSHAETGINGRQEMGELSQEALEDR